MDVIQFETPSNCIIAAPSSSGKTRFVFNILKNANLMFKNLPNNIDYCYSVKQGLFEQMERELSNT